MECNVDNIRTVFRSFSSRFLNCFFFFQEKFGLSSIINLFTKNSCLFWFRSGIHQIVGWKSKEVCSFFSLFPQHVQLDNYVPSILCFDFCGYWCSMAKLEKEEAIEMVVEMQVVENVVHQFLRLLRANHKMYLKLWRIGTLKWLSSPYRDTYVGIGTYGYLLLKHYSK